MVHPRKSPRAAAALVPFIAVALTVSSGVAHAQARPVFDNLSNVENGVTGASGTSTTSTPNTFIGDAFTLLPGTRDITGFDVAPVNFTGTNYTGLLSTIYVWGTVNTTVAVSANAPAFSNLLATYRFTSTGTYASGTSTTFYPLQTGSPGAAPGFTLAAPLAITSTTVGITVSFQGTTDGVNYAPANNLTSFITYGTTPTVGTNLFNGYYRNANSETNGNFTSTLRTLGFTNQSLALRIYGDVTASASAPEPSAVALSLSGAMLMVAGIARRRRSRA